GERAGNEGESAGNEGDSADNGDMSRDNHGVVTDHDGVAPGHRGAGERYGVAFDIGTTNIEAVLVSLPAGEARGRTTLGGAERARGVHAGAELARRQMANPQSKYGTDILSRIEAARDTDVARELHVMVTGALDALLGYVVGEAAAVSDEPLRVARLVAVGNPAMYAFLRGISGEALAHPPYDLGISEDVTVPACDLFSSVDDSGSAASVVLERDAVFYIPAPIASFCGSDALGLILATGIDRARSLKLAIDIGTNGEIALSDGKTIRIASVASGPAFEGGHLSCGMPAVEGAVYRVDRSDGGLSYHVIGGGSPRGVCGSGVIDLVAELVRAGVIDASGLFALRAGHAVAPGVRLSQDDVAAVQLAKAAFAGGILTLLERAKKKASAIRRVWVSGRFGSYLNPANAQAIGLLPPGIDPRCVELVGNGALEGAKLLVEERTKRRVANIRRKTKHVPLSGSARFNRHFLAHMRFPGKAG
ncbi:hypothetical protein AMJ39_09505, partial [candidate division TA06 bacterium DG_24]